jgi:hypothetical protein
MRKPGIKQPVDHFRTIGGYVSLALLGTWFIGTYGLYLGLVYNQIIKTHVDYSHTNAYTWPSHTLYAEGAIELLIQGSEFLRTGVDYSLCIHITFIDSWKTTMAGLVTFMSDFGQDLHTVASMIPCTHSPFVWMMRRLLLCPGYVTGLMNDSLERDVLISTVFRHVPIASRPRIDVPVYPVYAHHIEYAVRVHVVPSRHGHLPDIVSIYASYQVSYTSWYRYLLWYGYILWYICLTLTAMTTIPLYITCMTVHCVVKRYPHSLDVRIPVLLDSLKISEIEGEMKNG